MLPRPRIRLCRAGTLLCGYSKRNAIGVEWRHEHQVPIPEDSACHRSIERNRKGDRRPVRHERVHRLRCVTPSQEHQQSEHRPAGDGCHRSGIGAERGRKGEGAGHHHPLRGIRYQRLGGDDTARARQGADGYELLRCPERGQRVPPASQEEPALAGADYKFGGRIGVHTLSKSLQLVEIRPRSLCAGPQDGGPPVRRQMRPGRAGRHEDGLHQGPHER